MSIHRKTVFENGLRLITQNIAGTSAVTVLILAGAGSRYESKEINGLSHFLEHMFFKGAKKYKNAREVAQAIDSVGGDFNAFTGKEYAGYYVKVAAQNFALAVEVLADMMMHASFLQEEIDKERRVILEEYNMYQDTPMYQVGWDFERLLFGDQPMGWDQVGDKDFISSVGREAFVKYKGDLYTPDNTVIAIAGNIDHDQAVARIEKNFPFEKKKKAYAHKECLLPKRKEAVHLKHKKTEQGHIIVGFPAYHETHPDHFAIKLLSVILGGNMSSRMFSTIREQKGLTYYISTSTDDYQDVGVISTHAGVDVSRVEEAIASIVQEYGRIRDEGVELEELKKAREFIKGKMTLRLEDSEDFAHLLGKQELLHGRIRTPKEIFAELDKVSVDDIKRICEELFRPQQVRMSAIGPFEDKKKYEELLGEGW